MRDKGFSISVEQSSLFDDGGRAKVVIEGPRDEVFKAVAAWFGPSFTKVGVVDVCC